MEKTEFEYFLFVDWITDNHGDQLREISSTQDEEQVEPGCYSVRRGGCTSFNAMDAKVSEPSDGACWCIRSMAFSSTDKDGMKEVNERIEERVNQLGDKIKTE